MRTHHSVTLYVLCLSRFMKCLCAIQKVYKTIMNNTKGFCIVNKCCVYTDSFIVTCKFEVGREKERFVTRCLIRQDTDLCQRRIRKLVPRCDKCLICDGDETDVSYHFNCLRYR